ncbi:MAG: hypothetical protein Q8P86_04000 [bacterium]|nr:hypothetical protein [bacterium]
MSIFSLLATIVFIVSLAASAGAFFYHKALVGELQEMNDQLVRAKKEFEPQTIEEISRFSKRVGESIKILDSHTAMSNIFKIFEEGTLKTVRFSSFTYSFSGGSEASVSLSGEAVDFNAVALQSDEFGNNKLVKNPVFSNFQFTETGTVSFGFTASIPLSVISFKESINEE